jgi:hypothetical protein
MSSAPILDNKDLGAPSVFEQAALLREARRQKGLPATDVPPVCVLDPDGDIVRYLKGCSAARTVETWPCYHTVRARMPVRTKKLCTSVSMAIMLAPTSRQVSKPRGAASRMHDNVMVSTLSATP